jgi:pilus assembly protein CpaE
LFTERVTVPISDRLHLLAAQEPLEERTSLRGGTTERLIMTLRRRFNFVVADVPFHGSELADDVAWQAQGRVLVLLPTLGSVRDAARILALPGSPSQVRRPVLVLNRTGMAGTLSRSVVEQSLGTKIDVCIPDLPKVVGTAETLGEPAAKARGAFRNAMSQLAREVASVAAGPLPSKRWWRR